MPYTNRMIQTVYSTQSFLTSQENMCFDVKQLTRLDKKRFFRFYKWETPGITYNEKQALPKCLTQFCHSSRPTGGGVVFHAPGDLVFSVMGFHNDAFFPNTLKSLLHWLQNALKEALLSLGVGVTHALTLTEVERDIRYCSHYYSPYELSVNDKKVLALTLRRYQDRFLIQGILHLQDNRPFFSSVPGYRKYLSKGIKKAPSVQHIREVLEERWLLC